MIKKEMTILDIVEKYPKTEEIFKSYDKLVGKCVLCNNLFDSLDSFTADNNIDLQDLIDKIDNSI
ncbi:UTP-glucose-1-phosphate uridylyltransferase [Sedimentibacter acidaminivorans]|uniref:UTP-glucose-1-phosphate uridylyltransferase n=1 Tax=Sedimentibacter acidaminivorans TaxID=913099 RepID=A0ABS4GCI0_9FIRM|nr:hypothetical protein [Sedimentibacter acidaminivorans]MBP1925095.1 UTP-glucose-1-phosphate uridylyltransferase [Sedimentibacter acidaminivorans]